MLYVIYGASGTGKTTLLSCVREEYGNESIHIKGTTRPKRQYDDFEIESFPNGLPRDRFAPPKGYIYSQYENDYGIEKAQIDNALSKNIPHFVICNNIETIQQLRIYYKDKVKVIYLHFNAPRETILEIQKRRGIDDDEIELRMSKLDIIKENYLKNMNLFDQSLLNRYDENAEKVKMELSKDVKSLVLRYENLEQKSKKIKKSKRFKIGVTFTGKYRKKYIKPICESLVKHLKYNMEDIFYDDWHAIDIATISADELLKNIYKNQCECIVVFLSRDYNTKHWTKNIEWESIKELINTSDKKRILLFNMDSLDIDEVDGLSSKKDIFIDINKYKDRDGKPSIDTIAFMIDECYKKIKSEAKTRSI